MKITLNTVIPESQRLRVEEIVRNHTGGNAEILWLPSRFPHLVMFVDPGKGRDTTSAGSIFDSPASSEGTVASVTAYLEEKIKAAVDLPAKKKK